MPLNYLSEPTLDLSQRKSEARVVLIEMVRARGRFIEFKGGANENDSRILWKVRFEASTRYKAE